MRQKMVVHLYGKLGRTFGREFTLYVRSPAEALKLLEANFKGRFFKMLREGQYYVVRGRRFLEGKGMIPDQLGAGINGDELHVMAAASASSNKGLFMAIIGTVLVGAAIVLSGGSLAAPLASLTAIQGTGWGIAASLGLTMALGGVIQMLSPTAKTPNTTQGDQRARMFGGPVNITSQGGPVPVIYGRIRCGTVTASAGLHVVKATS